MTAATAVNFISKEHRQYWINELERDLEAMKRGRKKVHEYGHNEDYEELIRRNEDLLNRCLYSYIIAGHKERSKSTRRTLKLRQSKNFKRI